ncbi:MAG: hypothetical protein NZL99_08060 [Burkholderiaceae bacterium]|nr:hypothetical protein [Burkholderiaceae bacterium]
MIEGYDNLTRLRRSIDATRWEVFAASFALLAAFDVASLRVVRCADHPLRRQRAALEARSPGVTGSPPRPGAPRKRRDRHRRQTEKAEGAALAARRSAEAASLAKSEFLATVSEEMRTALNSATGTTDVLRNGDVTAVQRQNLTVVRSAVPALLKRLDDLVTLHRESPAEAAHCPETFSPLARVRKGMTLHAAGARSCWSRVPPPAFQTLSRATRGGGGCCYRVNGCGLPGAAPSRSASRASGRRTV